MYGNFLLADDLSGALEAGAAFVRWGGKAILPLSPISLSAVPKSFSDDALWVVNLQTRNVDEATLRERWNRWQTVLPHILPYYVKIDSTLRGAVGHLLTCLLETYPTVPVVVAPANPRVGRTVRHGVLYVHGVPLHQTSYANDPDYPIYRSAIVSRLQVGDTSLPKSVVIADAETEEDLQLLAHQILHEFAACIPVGSGGLVSAIAEQTANACSNTVVASEPHYQNSVRLYLVGSANAVSRQQAEILHQKRKVPQIGWEQANALEKVLSALREKRTAILTSSETVNLLNPKVAQRLAELSKAVLHQDATPPVSHLFLTGGETAEAVLQTIGCSWLTIQGVEEQSGAVFAKGDSTEFPMFAVKPGGFGDSQALVRLDSRWAGEGAEVSI